MPDVEEEAELAVSESAGLGVVVVSLLFSPPVISLILSVSLMD